MSDKLLQIPANLNIQCIKLEIDHSMFQYVELFDLIA